MAAVSFDTLFKKEGSDFVNIVAVNIPGLMKAGPGARLSNNTVNGVDPVASLEGKMVNVDIVNENGVDVYYIKGAAK